MEKVGLNEKRDFRNELKNIIYSNPGIDAATKYKIDSDVQKQLFGVSLNKDDLERIKKETLVLLEKNVSKVVDNVSNNLEKPNKSNISDVQDINTLKKDNGTILTSVKTNDGSIYVKDSSYSGDIKAVVKEVIKGNPNMTSQEIENKSFRTMQARQIDVPMTSINNSNLGEKERENLSKLPGDNKKINSQYQVMVDGKNRLIDLKNMQNNSDSYDKENNKSNTKSNNMEPKAKQLVKTINDAAFIDAMLLGGITLYTGILGLCAIFSKM